MQKTFKQKVEQIAAICHEANRAYCATLDDNSQPDWENAPQWQKDSAMNGVEFRLRNPNSSPEQSHENWMAQKRNEGWKYGEVKDIEKKEHPCFLPYNELPETQQQKDRLFQSIVDAFTHSIDLSFWLSK